MRYQWGRKDPYAFATSGEQWGADHQRGKYPVKIYTIDGVLIYQDEKGGNNKDNQPVGGVIVSSTLATSMMEAIKNPIMFYANPIINQSGHIKDLWDYYWTSYSRGTDGDTYPYSIKLHNSYLNGYVSSQLKSIYDPCPFRFRIPSNGTYNQFSPNSGWLNYDYRGGSVWTIGHSTWFHGLGYRNNTTGLFQNVSAWSFYYNSTKSSNTTSLTLGYNALGVIQLSRADIPCSFAMSVRCIEVSPPPRTDVTRLAVQEVSILVSKTVTLEV